MNSLKATKFRIWATGILWEYLIKGFVLDDERLKQGGRLFDKNYFNELLERIREIRASERMFYQKLTDIFAQSFDYGKTSPITKEFYASVQNKLEYAVVGKTAAEIITERADHRKAYMGLLTWKNVDYCGLSVSGKGYSVVIPIAYPAHHIQHFKELAKMFSTFGIMQEREFKLFRLNPKVLLIPNRFSIFAHKKQHAIYRRPLTYIPSRNNL